MHPFAFVRVADVPSAIAAVGRDSKAAFVAGGTEILNWLKEEIVTPARLVDINALPLGQIELNDDTLQLGALARLSDVATHPGVRGHVPALAEALDASASVQLRNMASIGGNLMQKTRCPYFRAETALPCNKRTAGSGCSALSGSTRSAAIFGWSEACVATHPSDLAVALAAFDARIRIRDLHGGERAIPIDAFYRLPESDPSHETTLAHGELIVAVDVPLSRAASHSRYLKIRERASYEFALVSVAAGIELESRTIREARIALGGVAPKPWRMHAAEAAVVGVALERDALFKALEPAFAEGRPLTENRFKVELARRAVVRTLLSAGASR